VQARPTEGACESTEHKQVGIGSDGHVPSCSGLDHLGLLNGVDVFCAKIPNYSGSHSTADIGSNSGPHSTADIRTITISNLSDSSTNIFVSNSGSNSGTHCGPDVSGSNTIPNACSDSTHKSTYYLGNGYVCHPLRTCFFFTCVPSAPAHIQHPRGSLSEGWSLLFSLCLLMNLSPHTARCLLTFIALDAHARVQRAMRLDDWVTINARALSTATLTATALRAHTVCLRTMPTTVCALSSVVVNQSTCR
jgi:hypothetical protein